MENDSKVIKYDILISKKNEDEINKILSCITKSDFPAVTEYKKYANKMKNKGYITDKNMVEHFDQIIRIYKKRIVICYILNMLNNDVINNNTPIKETIEYLRTVGNNNYAINQLKAIIRQEIEKTTDVDDRKQLWNKYGEIRDHAEKIDYNILGYLFAFNIYSIDKTIEDKYSINFRTSNVENPLIFDALDTISKYKNKNVEISVDKEPAKHL